MSSNHRYRLLWLLLLGALALLAVRLVSSAAVANVGNVLLLKALVSDPSSLARSSASDHELARLQAARQALAWAASVNPERASTYVMLARLEMLADRPEEARAYLERAYQRAPADVMVALTLGQLHQSQGDMKAAIRVWQSAPSIAKLHVARGQRALRAGDRTKAYEEFQLAVAIDPGSAAAYRGLGNSLRGLRRLDEAAQAYRRARALGEPNPYVVVELAHVLSMAGRDEEAVEELDAAGTGGALADAIRGSYYLKIGRLDQATRYLERAVQQEPENPWNRHALAIAYARQGRREAAISQLQEALQASPGFQPASDLLSCLASVIDSRACVGP